MQPRSVRGWQQRRSPPITAAQWLIEEYGEEALTVRPLEADKHLPDKVAPPDKPDQMKSPSA